MNRLGRLLCILTIVLGSSALSVRTADAQSQLLVDNVFFQTDLNQALEDIAVQTGENIITDPSVQGIVSVTLENVTLDEALELVLAGTPYRVARQPDYYLVYSPDADSSLFAEISETRLFELENIDPGTARSLLPQPFQNYVRVDEGTGRLAVTAPPELMARIEADLRTLDDQEEQTTTFIALQFVRPENARSLLPEQLQRYVRVDESRNTVAITAPGERRAEIVALLRRLDSPRPPAAVDVPDIYRTHIIELQHATAESVMSLLPEALGSFVRADTQSNTLAISAPPNMLAGIRQDISTIDVPRRHVMLDARVVVLERTDLLDFGTDISWPEIQLGGATSDNIDFPWELRIGYSPSRQFTNALSVTLNFLSSQQEATIVSSPQVLAQDGRPSEIRVTTEEFFEILTENNNNLTTSQLERIETGTILSITPRIGSSSDITLEMNLEVSDVVGRGENNLPVVSRRTAQSTIALEDGGTAAVAGLMDTRSQETASGVPGTTSLPLLGRLLGTDQLNHQARQVAIFVTATLVDQHGQRFQTGADDPPNIRSVSDEQFRSELADALNQLQQGEN
jgi:type II secretory pathway component GspD/PulD (secretin)